MTVAMSSRPEWRDLFFSEQLSINKSKCQWDFWVPLRCTRNDSSDVIWTLWRDLFFSEQLSINKSKCQWDFSVPLRCSRNDSSDVIGTLWRDLFYKLGFSSFMLLSVEMTLGFVNVSSMLVFKPDLFYFLWKFNFYETIRIQRACGLDSIVK